MKRAALPHFVVVVFVVVSVAAERLAVVEEEGRHRHPHQGVTQMYGAGGMGVQGVLLQIRESINVGRCRRLVAPGRSRAGR